MIIYFLKVILCQSILLLVFKLLLEREKMHVFNRFYLLFSILVSFAIPFIVIHLNNTSTPIVESVNLFNAGVEQMPETSQTAVVTVKGEVDTRMTMSKILLILYATICLCLLIRFIKNINAILQRTKQHDTLLYQGARLVFTNDNLTPHSFLHYIFVNAKMFADGNIEKEIFCHELAHVNQKHSLDIITIEILNIFIWFNPVLYLYKKAIQLNHEFLADDAVIKAYRNPSDYQQLLLQKATQCNTSLLTSPFNYFITKKRLIMMTRNTSSKITVLKQLALLPLLLGIILVFGTKTLAQDTLKASTKVRPQLSHTVNGATAEQMQVYREITTKHKTTDKKWPLRFMVDITDAEKATLESIFLQMSKMQQDTQTVAFLPPMGPSPKIVPTKAQFESWKNPNMYGVWIDDKKVSNSALSKYSATDFSHVFVSKLYGFAKKGKIYSYQVNIMTNAYYQKDSAFNAANKNNQMVLRSFPRQS